VRLAAIAAIAAALAALSAAPAATAEVCPDIEVVFARGTGEPPGFGVIGQSFVDGLRSDAVPKTVGVYAVNYPASNDYVTGIQGVVDAGNHVRELAAACPATKLALGGYSQGAGVMALLTSDGSLVGSPALPGLPGPLPPEVADRVAAVVLFGKPSTELTTSMGLPPLNVGPLLAARTLELCVDGDPICSAAQGGSIVPHLLYGMNGMAAQGADFAARRL
jgi:cutinase